MFFVIFGFVLFSLLLFRYFLVPVEVYDSLLYHSLLFLVYRVSHCRHCFWWWELQYIFCQLGLCSSLCYSIDTYWFQLRYVMLLGFPFIAVLVYRTSHTVTVFAVGENYIFLIKSFVVTQLVLCFGLINFHWDVWRCLLFLILLAVLEYEAFSVIIVGDGANISFLTSCVLVRC